MNRQTRHTDTIVSVSYRLSLLVGCWQGYVDHSFDRPHARWNSEGKWQPAVTKYNNHPMLTELRTYLLTYLLTPWSRALLQKLTGSQPVKKFPEFYGTRRFITVFASVRHVYLSWASSNHCISPHPTSWRSILILSNHVCLGLPSGLFPSGFPTKNPVYACLLPHTRYMPHPSHSSLIYHQNNIGWRV
jgi:hypothetical protein